MSIDLENAIPAHVQWKSRLQAAIDTNKKELDPAVICQDNKCDLGIWIYGAGKQYKLKSSYEVLRQKHAEFHKCAADVANKIISNDKVSAQKLLDGVFKETSLETVMAIQSLRREVG